MSFFAQRLNHVYDVCVQKKTTLHIAVNGPYGRFEACFDPGKQGLDPVPDYTSNSLQELLTMVENHIGIGTNLNPAEERWKRIKATAEEQGYVATYTRVRMEWMISLANTIGFQRFFGDYGAAEYYLGIPPQPE